MTSDRSSFDGQALDRQVECSATEAFCRFRDQGDSAALGEVFDATALRLTVIAGHLCRDAAQAEDLVQTTFLVAMRDAASFDGSRSAERWLAGILRHRALDAMRRRRRDAAAGEEALAAEADDEKGPLDIAADAELFEQVTAAIERIDGPSQQVLALRLVHDLEPTQIAHALGRSPGTVRMQLKRGLERLRELVPAGAAALVASLVVDGRGLAAVRASVLEAAASGLAATTATTANAVTGVSTSTSSASTTTTLATLTGALAVKHWIAVAAAFLVLVTAGFLLWEPDTADATRDRERSSVEVDLASHGDEPTARPELVDTTPAVVERNAVAASTTADLAEHSSSLVVRAVWEDSLEPATDVGVYVRPTIGGLGRERRTDATGRASFANLDAVALDVTCDRGSVHAQVEAHERGELRLVLPRGRTAAGLVVDIRGLPVEGAAIELVDGVHHRVMHELARTDADGRFLIENLDAESKLLARKDGWQPSEVERVDDDLEFVLGAKGHRLSGRVLGPSGEPVPFARLAIGVDEDAREIFEGSDLEPGEMEGAKKAMDLEGILAIADENGFYESREVPAGFVLVVARPSERDAGLVGAVSDHLFFGDELVLDVRLDSGAEVFGRVTDANGAPLAGLTIATEWEGVVETGQFEAELGAYVSDPHTVTDADGRYRLGGLLAGQYDLEVLIGDVTLARDDVEIERDETYEWSPIVANSASIGVRLVDSAGAPLGGWHVVAREPGSPAASWYELSATTDADGRATLFGLERDVEVDLALHAPTVDESAGGLPQGMRTGFVPSDEVHEIVVSDAERTTARVVGRWPFDPIVDPSLVVLTLERVAWRESTTTRVASDGSFAFDRLGAGRYVLTSGGGAYPRGEELAEIELGVGETLDLGELRRPLLGRIELDLVDADGAPVESASLGLVGRTEHTDAVFVRHDGRYTSSPLRPGSYALTIDAPGSAPAAYELEVTAAYLQPQRIELARGVRVPIAIDPYRTRTGSPSEVLLTVESDDGVRGPLLQRRIAGDGSGAELAIELFLAPGTYDLHVRDTSPARRGSDHTRIEVVAGEEREPVRVALD